MSFVGLNTIIISFLENIICFDLNHLNKEVTKNTNLEKETISKLCTYMYEDYSKNKDVYQKINVMGNHNKLTPHNSRINEATTEIYKDFNLSDDEYFFDNLRECYLNFIGGGIIQLYQNTTIDKWYPKILVKEILYPNDISTLKEEVIVYRGTSLEEFESKKYGQSWSLDKNIAKSFAFTKYIGQSRYIDTSRVVLCAKIKREDIFYFVKINTNGKLLEKEVIVNSEKIYGVNCIEKSHTA